MQPPSAPATDTCKLRIAAIDFLNPAPLMWDFEHAPFAAELSQRYVLHETMPSQCAAELAAGNADAGLIPIAAYATTPGLAVVPGCIIGSLNYVRSIILVVKDPDSIDSVRTVAADTSSRSSLAYAQILFRKFLGLTPEFVPHPPDLKAMLKKADAALLIGDPALLALEDRATIEDRAGCCYQWIDLAAEWHSHTGLPWVAAFWAVRPEAFVRCGIESAQFVADMQRSRNNGLAHIEDIVREWTPRIALPPATIHSYLTKNIHYVMDDACIEAIHLFYRYAAECGALPPAPPLRLL
ncbi:MAG: menaquinone biosynthetic enzyme MqnA/MqnD family protein [Acidobacteriaceae bacterium]